MKSRKHRWILGTVIVAIVLLILSTQVTFFVIQPIGAVPEGRTILMWRLSSMKFIDSADAWCERETDGVNLLCRLMVMGRVGEEATIIIRLPYIRTLYLASTGGATYER